MPKTLTFDIDNFKQGLHLLEDDTETPPGSARRMLNVLITDRGGIAPRPGTQLLGARSLVAEPVKGFCVFRKSFGAKEIPMRGRGTLMEAYHPSFGWFTIEAGYSALASEFDFVPNLVNVDNEDFVYFGNRYDIFRRWNGQIALLTSARVGGETAIIVDSTIEEDIFEEATATAGTTTSVTDSSKVWVTDQWKNFWVHITSGPQIGRVRKITANTANTLTFAALPGAPAVGNTFEITMAKFDPATNATFIYNGTQITVTAVEKKTELTVASAHASASGVPIATVPQKYASAPRGNRIESLLGRLLVGNVRSGLSRDAGGALQGSNSAGSVFVSRLNNPTEFSYSAARIAGEGDLISMPYGGGDITDISVQEDVAYVYKRRYIEAMKYSQDVNDIVIRTPLKSGVGSIGRVIKGKDDHFFITQDKQFTSIGRVMQKDSTPQTDNIGLPIKRLLEQYDFSEINGGEYRNRVLIACKSDSSEAHNNVILVWNETTKSFEGSWSIAASGFDIYGEELYYASAYEPNVWKMFTDGKSDVAGANKFPVTAVWESSFHNLLPVKGNTQSIVSMAFEGYIRSGSQFTVNLFKEFSSSPALSFDFGGLVDDAFLVGDDISAFLGANPLGLDPLGTIDAPGADGRRRFSFMVYFPYIYGQYFSLGFASEGKDQDWEIIRASLGLTESVSTLRSGIKSV